MLSTPRSTRSSMAFHAVRSPSSKDGLAKALVRLTRSVEPSRPSNVGSTDPIGNAWLPSPR